MRRLSLIFMLVSLLLLGRVHAEVYGYQDITSGVASLLSTFRQNVIASASALGYTPDQLQAIWGDYYYLLEKGLPSLQPDPVLQEAARRCVVVNLEAETVSYKPDESTLKEMGFDPFIAGAILTAVGFYNYISPEKAMEEMLVRLAPGSLTLSDPESAPLLYPAYTRVGAYLGYGSVQIQGSRVNVYMLCVVLASAKGDLHTSFLAGRSSADKTISAFSTTYHRLFTPLYYPDGTYYLHLPPGFYQLRTPDGMGVLIMVDTPRRIDL